MTSRRALLVGIDDYPFGPLAGCVNDATMLRDLLQQNEDGSPNFDCMAMLSSDANITRSTLREAVSSLFATDADAALLYFSGHGTENNLGGYLVTPDAKAYDEGVAMGEVLAFANDSRVREIVIILDCCNSGHLGSLPALKNEQAVLRQGISVLTASRAGENALETDGHGVFTSLVAAALEGGAADVIGQVTAAAVYAYVDQSLGPWDQRPLFKSHVSRFTPLRRCRPSVPVDILRRLPEWFMTPDAVVGLDPSFEDTAEPRHLTNEALFKLLQRCNRSKLVEPIDEEHMYYAAMNSTGCRLTPLGQHYWRLAKDGRI